MLTRKFQRLAFYVVLIAVIMALLLLLYRRHRAGHSLIPLGSTSLAPLLSTLSRSLSLTSTSSQNEGSIRYTVSIAGKESPHVAHSPSDVCAILPQCFPASHYTGKDDAETLSKCHRDIPSLIKYYHSGFAFEREGGRDNLVGFLSVLPLRHPNLLVLQIYNVCVHPLKRKRGIATKLVNESISGVLLHERALYAKNALEGKRDWVESPPVLLALDVNWEDEWVAEALALYVKMGFVRYMAPCENVYQFDYRKVLNTDNDIKKSRNVEGFPLTFFPFGSLYLRGLEWAEPKMERADGKLYGHFCMYKFLDDDILETARRMRKRYFELKAAHGTVNEVEEEE